jgi:uncharacterized membrane protein YkoI
MKSTEQADRKIPVTVVIISLCVIGVLIASGSAFAHIIFPSINNTTVNDSAEKVIETTRYIGEDAVKAIVIAEVPGSAIANFTELFLEYGDNKAEYNGVMTFDNVKYKFAIDAIDGTIIEWIANKNLIVAPVDSPAPTEKPAANTTPPANNHPAAPEVVKPTTNTSYIGMAAAKAIALKKVPGATFKEVSLEYDDGKVEYDGEMYLNNTAYKFKIDAVTGVIFEWESDTSDDDSSDDATDDSEGN